MDEITYWRLRAKLSQATILQMQADLASERAARDSDAAWKEAGVELRENAKLRFNDETHAVEFIE